MNPRRAPLTGAHSRVATLSHFALIDSAVFAEVRDFNGAPWKLLEKRFARGGGGGGGGARSASPNFGAARPCEVFEQRPSGWRALFVMLAGRLFVEVTGAAVRRQDVLDCQAARLSSQPRSSNTAKNMQLKKTDRYYWGLQ